MKIILATQSKLIEQPLPIKVEGNYWIKDYDINGKSKNLINIEAVQDKWCMVSNYQVGIIDSEQILEKVILEEEAVYNLIIENNQKAKIYCMPNPNNKMSIYEILDNSEIIIGKEQNVDLVNKTLNENQIIKFSEGKWSIAANNNAIYVNNIATTNKVLKNGDIVFINGILIIFFGNKMITNAIAASKKLAKINVSPRIALPLKENENDIFLETENYFYRSPRFKQAVEPLKMKIDAPPSSSTDEKELPAILTIGPMLTMGISSLMMSVNTITNMVMYDRPLWQGIPTIAMSIAMFTSMVIWPIFTKKFQKKLKEQNRKKIVKKYLDYLESKKEALAKAVVEQSRILNENFITLKECESIILNKKSNLWERAIEQEDFLTIRLGIGKRDLIGEIEYPNDSFTTAEDELRKEIEIMKGQEQKLENVPITITLTEKNIVGMLVGKTLKNNLIDGLMLQLLTFHSYEFLKIVILTDKQNENDWKNAKIIPHCWNHAKTERYYATTFENGKEVSLQLEKEYQERKSKNKKGYAEYGTYYLIITDNYNLYRELDIVKDILNQDENYGFSMVAIAETLAFIPSECQTFISIGQKTSGLIESEISKDNQKEFISDFLEVINMTEIYSKIANIPIEIKDSENLLPKVVSFLEMYDSGKIEHLNIKQRWEESNSVKSLAAPVGIDINGMAINLDLHEKYHGPHGLIAGMTGSGKSEFIITYVLSLATNYSPEDVSLILIDYKGGGLAKVFEDKSNNRILPHVAGTITNLDKNEISRALASIESELKRRQEIFNEARTITGESTIDIYKYQKLYKEGKLTKPVSHLFIICDEFAELKSDQPEFMEQLISTARIGRSLGVHLILATQKPSGVVNDQIWSNSRFRICLKVQDKSDSNEMIKCPDAATIKNIGRFYLQVGYNELFILGQSAYCGLQYYPAEKLRKKVDASVRIIDDVGNTIVSVEPKTNDDKKVSLGEELANVIDHIISIAKEKNILAERLWLEKLPEIIYTKDIKELYNYQKKPYDINLYIGEYDDPSNQKRGVVTLPLTQNGNTSIYGNAENGRDLMLSTIILEMCLNYSVDELNLYICDMGGEIFRQYNNLPQIGDIAFVNDEEKINNLIKYLERELEKRKKMFSNYNGTYENYIEKSGEKLPNIVVIINDYDTFTEVYEKMIETISTISRDSAKHGIIFILAANNSSSIRGRIRQNFPQNIVLKLNNKDNYTDFFGLRCKIEPADIDGRGIVKYDEMLEYQTARVFADDNFNDELKKLSDELKNMYNTKAKPIPVLPEKITPELLINNIDSTGIPIAMEAETTEVIKYDFKNAITTNIVSKNLESMKKMISGIIKLIQNDQSISLYVFDFGKSIDNKNITKDYYNDNFDTGISNLDKINKCFTEQYIQNSENKNELSKYKHYIVIMMNASNIESSISDESKAVLKNIITETDKHEKISFLMIDSAEKLSRLDYNEYFGKLINKDKYIWYGAGLGEQYNYKATLTYDEVKRKVAESFGYIVKKNVAEYVKFVEGEEDE